MGTSSKFGCESLDYPIFHFNFLLLFLQLSMLGDSTYLPIYPSLFDVTFLYLPPSPKKKASVNPWVPNAFTRHRNATSRRDELKL